MSAEAARQVRQAMDRNLANMPCGNCGRRNCEHTGVQLDECFAAMGEKLQSSVIIARVDIVSAFRLAIDQAYTDGLSRLGNDMSSTLAFIEAIPCPNGHFRLFPIIIEE